jgi:hypothetical protein
MSLRYTLVDQYISHRRTQQPLTFRMRNFLVRSGGGEGGDSTRSSPSSHSHCMPWSVSISQTILLWERFDNPAYLVHHAAESRIRNLERAKGSFRTQTGEIQVQRHTHGRYLRTVNHYGVKNELNSPVGRPEIQARRTITISRALRGI